MLRTTDEVPPTVRPTLRCLSEDLAVDLGSASGDAASARRVVAADVTHELPWRLAQIEHPVLTKARDSVVHEESLERLQSITDRAAFKVKTSNRRGAIWRDEDGQWWLLAAGVRKDDGSGDFYREVIDPLKGDSTSLLPDVHDLNYARFEAALDSEVEADKAAQRVVLEAILSAAGNRGTRVEIEIFGARITIRVATDQDDDPTELTVEIEMMSFEEQDRFPEDLLALVPFFGDMYMWDVVPPVAPGDAPIWWTTVNERWIEWLEVAVELDELLAQGLPNTASPPGPSHPQNFSHFAAGHVVTVGYVEGVEIAALCGFRFTPSRDPDPLDPCSACGEVLSLLRSARGET